MRSADVKNRTRNLVRTAICVALLVLSSVVSIPIPGGVPITLQTFTLALIGFLFGVKTGVSTVFVFLLIGLTGLPVFSSFGGGVGVFVGPTGGFLWGFFPFVALAGISGGRGARLLYALGGLFICHILGALQFSLVSGCSFETGIITVSLPYLIKDVACVIFAGFFADQISDRAVGIDKK